MPDLRPFHERTRSPLQSPSTTVTLSAATCAIRVARNKNMAMQNPGLKIFLTDDHLKESIGIYSDL